MIRGHQEGTDGADTFRDGPSHSNAAFERSQPSQCLRSGLCRIFRSMEERHIAAHFSACEPNLCTQSEVLSARARARPRAPKVGSPASTLLRSNRALESVIEWAETTKRGDLSIECDQILPELFILTGDLLPQRRRVLSFPWGRGAGRQAVARARRGLHGNQLPAQIQRARRHVSLLIPRRPSSLVWALLARP